MKKAYLQVRRKVNRLFRSFLDQIKTHAWFRPVRLLENVLQAQLDQMEFWRQALRRTFRKATKKRPAPVLMGRSAGNAWMPAGTFTNMGLVALAGHEFSGSIGSGAGDIVDINWGDGTESGTTFAGAVDAAHTYTEPGYYAIGMISFYEDTGSVAATGIGLAVVVDPTMPDLNVQVMGSEMLPDQAFQVLGGHSLSSTVEADQSSGIIWSCDGGLNTITADASGTINYTFEKTVAELHGNATTTQTESISYGLEGTTHFGGDDPVPGRVGIYHPRCQRVG